MSIPFYSSLNMNGNTIENAEGLEGGSSVYLEKPESPVKGDIYFNSSEGKLEIYSGYNWVVYDSNAITTTTDYSGSISTTDCYAVSPGVATFAGSKFYIKFHRAPKSAVGTVGLAVGSLGQISFVNPDGSSVQCSQIKNGMIVQFYLVSLKTAKLITPIPTNVNVENNLTSTSATNALSANQGNVLYTMINDLPSNDYRINKPTVIGTWIDKPLYRTVQVATLDTNTMEDNTITLDDLTSGTSIPVHIYGYTYLSAADKVIYFDNHKNTAGTTTGIYIAEYHPNTRILDYYIAANTASEIRAEGGNTKLYFIVEYFEN